MLNKRKYVRSFFEAHAAKEIDEESFVAVVFYIPYNIYIFPASACLIPLILCARCTVCAVCAHSHTHKFDAPLLSLLTLCLRIFSGQLRFFFFFFFTSLHFFTASNFLHFTLGFSAYDVVPPSEDGILGLFYDHE